MKIPTVDISAILVSYNTVALLPDVILALQNASGSLSVQTIIVDNASRDASAEFIGRNYTSCDLIVNSENVGFGRANNQALPLVKGRFVLLLNTDAFVAPDTLMKTMDYLNAHPECGALGVRLIGRDGQLQPSCRYFPTPINGFLQRTGLCRFLPWVKMVDDMEWDHATSRECDWVPGCYLLIRREVIEQVGLFDPRYFLYCEEVDFCFAAKKAGWQIHYFSDTTVVHIGGESAKSDNNITSGGRQIESMQVESEVLYFRKNHGAFALFLNIIFNFFLDLIIPFKQIFTCKRSSNWLQHWSHMNLLWRIYRKTKFGNIPIR